MEMRVEACDGMNPTDGHIELRGELPQLISRQIPELLLDRPELIEQGARVPLAPRRGFARIAQILTAMMRTRECRSWNTESPECLYGRAARVPNCPLFRPAELGISKAYPLIMRGLLPPSDER